jgi:AcrR family transcriptional regulator
MHMVHAPRPPDSTHPAPGRPRNARSHAAILQATVELLTEIGYQAMTIEGIAARARVGKTTVYRWWPSKGALVVEAIREKIPLPPAQGTGDPRTDLHTAIADTTVLFQHSPTGIALPALVADLMHEPDAGALIQTLLQPRRESVLRIFDDAVRRGLLPANIDAPMLIDLYTGAIYYRMLVRGEPLPTTMIDQLTTLLLDSTLPTTETSSANPD